MTFKFPHFDRSPDQDEKAILAGAAYPPSAYASLPPWGNSGRRRRVGADIHRF